MRSATLRESQYRRSSLAWSFKRVMRTAGFMTARLSLNEVPRTGRHREQVLVVPVPGSSILL
jgi:hypothetical protein